MHPMGTAQGPEAEPGLRCENERALDETVPFGDINALLDSATECTDLVKALKELAKHLGSIPAVAEELQVWTSGMISVPSAEDG